MQHIGGSINRSLESFRDSFGKYNPTTIALFSVAFAAIWLYTLGNTYSYYLNFVVLQATILIFVHNYSNDNDPTIYTTAGIILLYLFYLIFNIDTTSRESSVSFFIKLILVMIVFIQRKHIAFKYEWINIFTLTVTFIIYLWIVSDIANTAFTRSLI